METKGVDFAAIPTTAVRVLASPSTFFREMPKTGGFVGPLVFVVVMGVIGGLIQAIENLLGLHVVTGMAMGVASVIVAPILVAIFSFVGAAVLFVIWKPLGSDQSYETAYRCGAYVGALAPVLAILNVIPYVGAALGIVLLTYFTVTASVETHGIAPRKAWVVFGVIGAIGVFGIIGAEIAVRQLARQAETFRLQVEKAGKEMQGQAEQFQKQAAEFEKLSKDAERAMQAEMEKTQVSDEEARREMDQAEMARRKEGR